MSDFRATLPPNFNEPPNCACRGRSPHMREHTPFYCAVLTTEEIDAVTEGRPVDMEKQPPGINDVLGVPVDDSK